MKKLNAFFWGAALIVVGVLFALKTLNVVDINIFFSGWWTLFIIVPCLFGLITDKDKLGNIIGLFVGVFLLLACQDVFGFDMLWKIGVPAIIVIIGLKLILTALFNDKASKMVTVSKENGEEIKVINATFSGQDIQLDGEKFQGAELSAIFGGIKLNLKNAVIEKDCAIILSAIFGGIDIYIPDNVNVKITSNSAFGGVSNKKSNANVEGQPTIYITATCVFGGADIK